MKYNEVTKSFSQRFFGFLKSFFTNIFALDPRGVAALRIALGFALIAETLWQIPNIVAFFSHMGVYPPSDYWYFAPPLHAWSFHLMSGDLWFQYLLFFLQFLVGTCMIVGYRSRIMTFLGWAALISMQARTLHTLYGGDVLIRVAFFWAMFLPTGQVWSLDSLLQAKKGIKPTKNPLLPVFSIASIGYVLQMAIYMLDTAIHKMDPSWTKNFSAIEQSLQSGIYRIPPIGDWFLTFPSHILAIFTIIIISLEFISPLLLLIPIKRGWGKILGVFGLWAIHLGIGISMSVDLFPLFGILTAFGLLPASFWDFWTRKFPKLKINETFEVKTTQNEQEKLKKYGSWVISGLLVFPLAMTIKYNAADQGWIPHNEYQNNLLYNLRLDQRWKMFSPPPRIESWVTAIGNTKNGGKVDVWKDFIGKNKTELSNKKPEDNYRTFPTEKWHKYLDGLAGNAHNKQNQSRMLGNFLCRWYNGKLTKENVYQDRLLDVSVSYWSHRINNDNSRTAPWVAEITINHNCN